MIRKQNKKLRKNMQVNPIIIGLIIVAIIFGVVLYYQQLAPSVVDNPPEITAMWTDPESAAANELIELCFEVEDDKGISTIYFDSPSNSFLIEIENEVRSSQCFTENLTAGTYSWTTQAIDTANQTSDIYDFELVVK